jgi:hypothetical protein
MSDINDVVSELWSRWWFVHSSTPAWDEVDALCDAVFRAEYGTIHGVILGPPQARRLRGAAKPHPRLKQFLKGVDLQDELDP